MRKDTLLVIPAYNEEENIGPIISGLLDDKVNGSMDILAVNDCSADGTLRLLRSFEPEIRVVDHIIHMGYGAALQTGYKYAARHGYSYVLQMDSDGQHDHRSLSAILSRLKGETPAPDPEPVKKADVTPRRIPDIVIGSRFLGREQPSGSAD